MRPAIRDMGAEVGYCGLAYGEWEEAQRPMGTSTLCQYACLALRFLPVGSHLATESGRWLRRARESRRKRRTYPRQDPSGRFCSDGVPCSP